MQGSAEIGNASYCVEWARIHRFSEATNRAINFHMSQIINLVNCTLRVEL